MLLSVNILHNFSSTTGSEHVYMAVGFNDQSPDQGIAMYYGQGGSTEALLTTKAIPFLSWSTAHMDEIL
jgi:hypothetical protein